MGLNHASVLHYLNNLETEPGFIYSEYSCEGTKNKKFTRQYFTGNNAAKIDSIRNKITAWKEANLLNDIEEAVLLSSLLIAVNRVANIAGTYGCFLKDWDKRAFNPLRLERFRLMSRNDKDNHQVWKEDTLNLAGRIKPEIVYLDPPYTWRHYGAYYHLLETIATGDTFEVSGKTGLRPWQDASSPFCYRDKAAGALGELLNQLDCEHLFLSYNSEGLIHHEQIMDMFAARGKVQVKDIQFQRYKSNNCGSGLSKVKERIYYVKCK